MTRAKALQAIRAEIENCRDNFRGSPFSKRLYGSGDLIDSFYKAVYLFTDQRTVRAIAQNSGASKVEVRQAIANALFMTVSEYLTRKHMLASNEKGRENFKQHGTPNHATPNEIRFPRITLDIPPIDTDKQLLNWLLLSDWEGAEDFANDTLARQLVLFEPTGADRDLGAIDFILED